MGGTTRGTQGEWGQRGVREPIRVILLVMLVLGTAARMNSEAILLPQPGDEAWQAFDFPNIEKHTRYEVVQPSDLPGRKAFRSSADCSASAMILPLDHVDDAAYPRISWRWRIRTPIEVADETVKAGDDFAARVYVMFAFEPEHASMWRRAQQEMGESMWDRTLPGVALNFVWSSHMSPGRRWVNPFSKESAMVALRSGRPPHDGWVREEVAIAAEHQRSFGRKPAKRVAVAIMTDTDGICQKGSAEFADFRLLPPAAPSQPAVTPKKP